MAQGLLNIAVTGDKEVLARFDAIPAKVHRALYARIFGLALELEHYIKTEKLSGQVLNHRTGKLQSSINSEVKESGANIIGRVFSNNSVNYAAIHEFGGQVPDRYPVNGKALHFFIGGKEVFAKFARGFTMPERSFMRSGLADYKEKIIAGMTDAVKKAVAEK